MFELRSAEAVLLVRFPGIDCPIVNTPELKNYAILLFKPFLIGWHSDCNVDDTMNSIKQSNWILGLGVFVAILLIVTTLWLRLNPEKSNDTVKNKAVPEIGQTINQVQLNKLAWLSSILKTLN